MVRARIAGVALAAALGLACGCSTPSGCSTCSGGSFTSRLTSLFRRNRAPVEEVGSPVEGPVIADPGPGPEEGPGWAPVPQTFPPPLAPPPPSLHEAQRMPYQP